MLNLKAEKQIFNLNYQSLAGIDEAGRGPLAGPVVAACVLIDQQFIVDDDNLKQIADSKKLSPKKREKLFSIIKEKALDVQIGVVSSKVIDKINILQASFLAMRKAINSLNKNPQYLLVDGHYKIPEININQSSIVKGDSKIFSIAAASIVAKVSRDWLMTQLDHKYPVYNFKKHKGYGTKEHLKKIKEFGPCPIHRLSFAPFNIKKSPSKLERAYG